MLEERVSREGWREMEHGNSSKHDVPDITWSAWQLLEHPMKLENCLKPMADFPQWFVQFLQLYRGPPSTVPLEETEQLEHVDKGMKECLY